MSQEVICQWSGPDPWMAGFSLQIQYFIYYT